MFFVKCPYCAERIQDEAVLCRFCGARRAEQGWSAPEKPKAPPARNTTIFLTGWLLLLSGAWALFSLTAPVALVGAARTGVVALIFNGLYAGSFLAMGAALIWRKPWALRTTLVASAFYTLDKLELVLDPAARAVALGESASMVGEFGPMVEQALLFAGLFFLAGWWSFVVYLYFKRDYFESGDPTR